MSSPGELADHADAPFIVADSRTLTYGETDRESNRIANAVEALGSPPGTPCRRVPATCRVRPGLRSASRPAWCHPGAGQHRLPRQPGWWPTLLATISAATTMIVEAQYLERLAEVADRLEHLERLVVLDRGEAPTAIPAPLAGLARVAFPSLLDAPDTARESLPAYHDIKAIMYTSGTTGPSKGVMVTQAHAYDAHGGIGLMELKPGDVYYAPLPLFHIAGQWAMVYAAMIGGAAAVGDRAFQRRAFLADARRFNATVTFFLGAMANFLARQPARPDDAEVPIERALVVPMFHDVAEFGRRFGMRIKTTYGWTEVSAPMRIAWDHPDWKTCGHLLDELFEARIVDENDEEVPDGTVGEFVIRAREPWLLMAGYWRHPEWTQKAWSQPVAAFRRRHVAQHRGYYSLRRPVKDSIRRRGENISSMEVELEVNAHPAVVECAVFPVPSEHTEDEVMAIVVVKPGQTLDPVELIRFPRAAHGLLHGAALRRSRRGPAQDADRQDPEIRASRSRPHADDLGSRSRRHQAETLKERAMRTERPLTPDQIVAYSSRRLPAHPGLVRRGRDRAVQKALADDPSVGGRLTTVHDGTEKTRHDYLGWTRHGDDWLGSATRLARNVEGAAALIGEQVYHWHSKLVKKPAGNSAPGGLAPGLQRLVPGRLPDAGDAHRDRGTDSRDRAERLPAHAARLPSDGPRRPRAGHGRLCRHPATPARRHAGALRGCRRHDEAGRWPLLPRQRGALLVRESQRRGPRVAGVLLQRHLDPPVFDGQEHHAVKPMEIAPDNTLRDGLYSGVFGRTPICDIDNPRDEGYKIFHREWVPALNSTVRDTFAATSAISSVMRLAKTSKR